MRRDVGNNVGVFRLGSQPGDQKERGRLLHLALDLFGSHVLCRNSGRAVTGSVCRTWEAAKLAMVVTGVSQPLRRFSPSARAALRTVVF